MEIIDLGNKLYINIHRILQEVREVDFQLYNRDWKSMGTNDKTKVN